MIPREQSMTDRYFVVPPIKGRQASLVGAEAHHLIHVMRAGPGSRVLTVRVANNSGWEVSDVEVTLRRDAVDGDLLTTLVIPEALAPGTHHDVSWVWEGFGPCGGTVNVYAIVDEGDAVAEFDETNNTRMALAQLSEPFTPFDLDYDGLVNIIGDVAPLVDCLYRDDCHCPAPGCLCPSRRKRSLVAALRQTFPQIGCCGRRCCTPRRARNNSGRTVFPPRRRRARRSECGTRRVPGRATSPALISRNACCPSLAPIEAPSVNIAHLARLMAGRFGDVQAAENSMCSCLSERSRK